MLSLSRYFQPFFTTRPISQIIYVGSRAKPKYQKKLNDVGKQLGVPVHWCLGGLASDKFRRNWERHRRDHRRREAEEEAAEENEEEEEETAQLVSLAPRPLSSGQPRDAAEDGSTRQQDHVGRSDGASQPPPPFRVNQAIRGAAAATNPPGSTSSPRGNAYSTTAGIPFLRRRTRTGRHVSFAQDARDKDDDDDVNDGAAFSRKRRPRHLDTCAQFIRNMLQRRKNQRKRAATTSSAAANAAASLAPPTAENYVKTTLLNKRHRAGKRLNARPKIGSLKKASEFLTLRDKSLNRLGFLALAPQQPPTPPRSGWGGAMVTRAAARSLSSGLTTPPAATVTPPTTTTTTTRRRNKRRMNHNNDDDDDNDDGKDPNPARRSATATTTIETARGRRRNGKRVKFLVDDDNDPSLRQDRGTDTDDDDNHNDDPIPLSREDEALVDKTIEAEEAESFSFLPDSLLLFDDCLVPISSFDHQQPPGSTTTTTTTTTTTPSKNSHNAARKTQNIFTETLQFLSSLALEHAHHDSLHFVVTSQSVLSSAGTSAVARCFKTLRQNIDAHILFDQPLQDARSFFTNLVSGPGECAEGRVQSVYPDILFSVWLFHTFLPTHIPRRFYQFEKRFSRNRGQRPAGNTLR